MNIPILLYHSVSDQTTQMYRPWAISPASFEEHMIYLNEQGYHPMTIGEVVETIKFKRDGLPGRPVCITFDDGLVDFLYGAMPILKKYNIPATLYVATGYVGETSRWLDEVGEQNRPMLTWEQIAELENVEVGSHGHAHFQMDIISRSRARDEFINSKSILENKLNRCVETFAFPHGYHTKELLDIATQTGYTSNCIVGHAMATDTSSIFALPRIIVTSDVTVQVLERYLHGVGLRKNNIWRVPLKTTWRIIRRMKTFRKQGRQRYI